MQRVRFGQCLDGVDVLIEAARTVANIQGDSITKLLSNKVGFN